MTLNKMHIGICTFGLFQSVIWNIASWEVDLPLNGEHDGKERVNLGKYNMQVKPTLRV